MKQILIIHGGDSFSTYDNYISYLTQLDIDYERLKYHKSWKSWIAEQLPEADVLLPTFPNASNAQFDEWSLYFEKILPLLEDDVTLVGHSLGGMFLAKYLQQKLLPRRFRRIVLVAPLYGDSNDVGSFAVEDATAIPDSAQDIHLFHSEDDHVVDYTSLAKFAADMPGATVHSFSDRGHFNQETFPELLEILTQE